MRLLCTLLIVFLLCNSCGKKAHENNIEGTWKMIYAEIKQGDSVEIKDLSDTDFIKIINASHFAFINQDNSNFKNFYSGGGTYTYNGNEYIETLSFTSEKLIRDSEFHFTVIVRGDTLTQTGTEEIHELGLKKEITETYIKVN